jgi:hypothetical protein
MNLVAVPFPTAFRIPPDSASVPGSVENQCLGLLRLLTDMAEDGILLVDQESRIVTEINRFVRAWPRNYGDHFRQVFRRLIDRERVVAVGLAPTNCARTLCTASIELLTSYPAHAAVVPRACTCSDQRCQNLPNGVRAEGFVSLREKFDYSQYSLGGLRLNDGEWDRSRFEEDFLAPLFRFSKDVRVIDRNIGRHIGISSGRTFEQVVPGYAHGLTMVVSAFSRFRLTDTPGRIEVVTEIPRRKQRNAPQLTDQQIADTARLIEDFTRRLGAMYSAQMLSDIRVSNTYADTEHDRFLITNQTAVTIGRGLDILHRDGVRVRGVTATKLPDKQSVLKLNRFMSSLETIDDFCIRTGARR